MQEVAACLCNCKLDITKIMRVSREFLGINEPRVALTKYVVSAFLKTAGTMGLSKVSPKR